MLSIHHIQTFQHPEYRRVHKAANRSTRDISESEAFSSTITL